MEFIGNLEAHRGDKNITVMKPEPSAPDNQSSLSESSASEAQASLSALDIKAEAMDEEEDNITLRPSQTWSPISPQSHNRQSSNTLSVPSMGKARRSRPLAPRPSGRLSLPSMAPTRAQGFVAVNSPGAGQRFSFHGSPSAESHGPKGLRLGTESDEPFNLDDE